MRTAQIIVDLPLMQTDKPFSYLIPAEMEDILQGGMRVHLPFGLGNRLIQGIVVDFSEVDAENVEMELKEIAELLDPEPVLTKEQLELADKMRHSIFSFKISLLKTMLPSLLNSNYEKYFILPDGSKKANSDLTEQEQILAVRNVQQELWTVEYTAKSKENRKTEKYIRLIDLDKLAAFEIKKAAKKKQEFKYFLLRNSHVELLKKNELEFSLPVIKSFIEEGLVEEVEIEVSRTQDKFESIESDQAKKLNPEQEAAYQALIAGSDKPYLLEGITGSGKTEVYLQVIEHYLKQDKTAIMLVPEISLTPMMTNRFIARFGEQVAIMHSGLSDGEKYDEWRKIKRGDAKVVVGARSAIFAPLEKIGVIIIDEEHESSYKQDNNPKYHARDVALLRAQYHNAILVLGSATPSLESRARAQKGVYQLLNLTQRANPNAILPRVELVDMRKHLNDNSADFSQKLLDKIKEKVDKNEQVVLMLNRRGYSSFVMCRDCGFVVECPNCDISLTLHMDTHTLNCHYCGHTQAIPHNCPSCNSTKIRYYGTGTQKIEEELLKLMPEVRILRMDVDTTRKKNAHERILEQFGKGEADILLGTQMIAKGLDFPNVTLVGVINADTGLNLPDFRASERTFQLLMQVAGRAGRADKAGEVLIQTFNPSHYTLQLAGKQDYEAFYKQEMSFRRNLNYPPYFYTVQILLSHQNEEFVVKKAYEMNKIIRQSLSNQARILGPIPKPIARTHNLYHYQILIKYRFETELEETLNQILDLTQERENKDLRVMIDSEPQNFI